jgi:hypothetical protein
MKKLLLITVVAIGLAGCGATDRLALLENLKGCDRHYEGVVATASFGAPGISGTVKIDCKAQAPPAWSPVPTP